jgi:glycosyltransferase involved in cell wall biosynthesis
LRYAKGYWHLVRAFSQIRAEHPNTHLVILGNNHADNRKKLDRLVESLDLSDAVSFLGFDENPFKYLARSDVYVLSSISEGFPNSLVEAMACGTPVVAADCKTGPREILCSTYHDKEILNVEHAEYGILVPAHEPTEIYDNRPLLRSEFLMAKAIVELLRDEKLRRYYGDQAKKRAADFGYSRWKDNIYEILRD